MASRPITDARHMAESDQGQPPMITQNPGPDPPSWMFQAHELFCRDLGQLLEERPGQWVAYRGTTRIGFAPSKTSLFQRCLSLGLKRGEFLVRCIEPAPGDTLMGPWILEGIGLPGEGSSGGPAS